MTLSSYDIMETFDFYYDEMKARSFENYDLFNLEYPQIINVIKELFDAEQRILSNYLWMLTSNFHNGAKSKIITTGAYSKNMYSLFTAIELCLKGFHGSARIILRQVVEFLMLAKYASITHDEKFINHWEKGGDIGIGKQILQKLKIRNKKNLIDLWELLCGFNHATSYSQQIGVRYEEVKKDTLGDLAVIIILLNCNLHLLNQHVIDRRMKYFASC